MKLYRWCLVLMLAATGCEEKTELPIMAEDTGLLVVEAVLTNENKNHLVRLTHPYTSQNGAPRPASGALVWVGADTAALRLTEFPAGSGMYYTPAGRAVAGKRYSLYIRYGGKEFFAHDNSVPVQPMQSLKLHNGADGYSLALAPSGDDPNYIEHVITWRQTDACASADKCEGRVVYYDLKTIDVHELFKPEKEPFYFPRMSRVVRRKFSVSPAYKAYLRSMLSETEWRGGVFDVQRANLPTNLSEGAAGFFAVCTVVSDTTIVK